MWVFLGYGTLGAKTGKVSTPHPLALRVPWTVFYHVASWAPEPLEERSGVIHACISQYLPCSRHSVSSSQICCLLFNSTKVPNILCRNVTMLSWPGERHSVVCSREGSSFRVGGQAGCRLSFGRAFASLWIQNTMAASITEEWSYSHHRYRAHLNIPVHTIPIKGAGLQKVAILEVLSLMEGKSKFSLSLSASVLHGESE